MFESQYVIDNIVEVFGKGEIRLAMDLTQRDFQIRELRTGQNQHNLRDRIS